MSAVTGVAGGILLLSALLVALDPRAVVPVHGAVQLIANGARLVTFREHVVWPVVRRFVVAVVPGTVLGAMLVGSLPPRALQILIAVGILVTLIPRNKPEAHEVTEHRGLFETVGFLSGFLGMLVGSTGPIVSQGLLYAGITKERHIATKSVCQAVGHGMKIPAFGWALGFDFGDNAVLIGVLGASVIVGTLVGKQLLEKVSDDVFVRVTRVLLALIAVRILVG